MQTKEKPVYLRYTMTEVSDNFRINEVLYGRLKAIKMTGDVEYFVSNTENVTLMSTVERPLDFGDDLFGWLDYVKAEAKRLKNENFLKEVEDKKARERSFQERRKVAEREKQTFITDFFKPIKEWNLKQKQVAVC